MKAIKLLAAGLTLFIVACSVQKQMAQGNNQQTEEGISNAMPLPTGNYFIVNASTNLALTPLSASAGQNVFLQRFNHGGTQQWHITRNIKTNTYVIKLSGTDAMIFQPHDLHERTATIGPGSSGTSFKIVPVTDKPDYWYIKSLKYNGDAMQPYVFSPELPTEARFNPIDGDRKFMWYFVKVAE